VRTFERFVAIGDSTAEGIGDFDTAGRARGFADRLAGRLARYQGAVAYANLAVSGTVARAIRGHQLAPALALRPDLAAIMAGMNDLLQPRFDASATGEHIAAMQRAFAATGCTVLAFTLPDVAHRLAVPPIDRLLSRRTRALNDAIRGASATTGAIVIDLAAHPMAADPRMWSRDRLHGNPESHERIAAACAQALALPGADGWWRESLPPLARSRVSRLAERVDWGVRYLVPWLRNRVRRPPELDRRVAKHTDLVRITAR
jgi:lysophospholipase L1-like esterase